MEQFFFNNDLDGVIQTLEKHTTREHALEMLEKMDNMDNYVKVIVE